MTGPVAVQRGPLPPLYFLAAEAVQAALHFILPFARIVARPLNLLGFVFVLFGITTAMAARRAFIRVKTPVAPSETPIMLVTGGPFRFTRNPMYLGLVSVLIGTALLWGTLSPWLVVPAFGWLLSSRFIQHEERVMTQLFGEPYVEYRRRVRRWL